MLFCCRHKPLHSNGRLYYFTRWKQHKRFWPSRGHRLTVGFPGQLQPDSLSEIQDDTIIIFITFTYICTSKKWWSISFLLSHINWMALHSFTLGSEWKSCSASIPAVYFTSDYYLFSILLSMYIQMCYETMHVYICTIKIHVFCRYSKDSSANTLKRPSIIQRSHWKRVVKELRLQTTHCSSPRA